MSNSNYHSKKESKSIKSLFSVVCLCIIALGLIVYFSATQRTAPKNNAVNENQTLEVTTEVQRAVTIQETTAPQTEAATEAAPTTAGKGAEKTTESASMPLGESNTPYKSFYKYPLTEAIVKGYSEELVYDETMGDYRAHAAVDFKGNKGDKVVAINDGIVTKVYTDNMRGGVVEIDHGGKLTVRYCGLKSFAVKAGKRVDIGNTIGTLGTVMMESGEDVHLHLEARLDGKPVNPLDVMGKTE